MGAIPGQFAAAQANSATFLACGRSKLNGSDVQPVCPGNVQKARPSLPAAWTISTFLVAATCATSKPCFPMGANAACQSGSLLTVQNAPPHVGFGRASHH